MFAHRPIHLLNVRPSALERAFGLAVFAAAGAAVLVVQGPWPPALALLFVPDLSALLMLGRVDVGAAAYNVGHRWPGPIALMVLGAVVAAAGSSVLLLAGLLWVGHVGMDRALGYGLKSVIA